MSTTPEPSPRSFDLPAAITQIRELHGVEVDYRPLYTLCLSSKVPGIYRGTNGRWRIRPDALADIAGIFRARTA